MRKIAGDWLIGNKLARRRGDVDCIDNPRQRQKEPDDDNHSNQTNSGSGSAGRYVNRASVTSWWDANLVD